MKPSSLVLSLLAAAPLLSAQAAPVALEGLSWSATGVAGLIGGNSTVPLSSTGNASFGYLTTADSTALGVSPLHLKTDGKGSEKDENGSIIASSAFTATANSTLSLSFSYVSTDGRGYDDYAWARLVQAGTNDTAAWLFTARSTNSARGHVVPGDVLERQTNKDAPDELDAVLNNGNSVGFNVSSTEWAPLGFSSGYCWDSANTCGPSGWIQSEYAVANSGSYYLEFGVVNWGDEAFDSALAFDYAGLSTARFSGVRPLEPVTAVPEPDSLVLVLAGLGLLRVVGERRDLLPRA